YANELGGEVIAPAAAHDPTGPLGVPLQTGDLGVKQGVVVETELLPDTLAVLENLGRMRILLGWHVTCLFQQRHVDEARRVALRPRVAVPVPGAAEVTPLLDDPDIVDARLLQPGTGDQPREAPADERHRDVVGLRPSGRDRRVRVVGVVGELILQFLVLVVAVRPQTLGPLLRVRPLQGVLIDGHRLRVKANLTERSRPAMSSAWTPRSGSLCAAPPLPVRRPRKPQWPTVP